MDDVRRFAPDRSCTLPVPALGRAGLRIALDDDALARVVVCPSTFEGSGLPPIEGHVTGVPVLASDIPTHREFLDGAVRYFPPHDDIALAREIGAATSQPSSRPAVRSPVLADLTIDASAARLLPGLSRLLSGAA